MKNIYGVDYSDDKAKEYFAEEFRRQNPAPLPSGNLMSMYQNNGYKLSEGTINAIGMATGLDLSGVDIQYQDLPNIANSLAHTILQNGKPINFSALKDVNIDDEAREAVNYLQDIELWRRGILAKAQDPEHLDLVMKSIEMQGYIIPPRDIASEFKEMAENSGEVIVTPDYEVKEDDGKIQMTDSIRLQLFLGGGVNWYADDLDEQIRQAGLLAQATPTTPVTEEEVSRGSYDFLGKMSPLFLPSTIINKFFSGEKQPVPHKVIAEQMRNNMPKIMLENMSDGEIEKAARYYALGFAFGNNKMGNSFLQLGQNVLMGNITDHTGTEEYQYILEAERNQFGTVSDKIFGFDRDNLAVNIALFGGTIAASGGLTSAIGVSALKASTTASVAKKLALSAAKGFTQGAAYSIVDQFVKDDERDIEDRIKSTAMYGGIGAGFNTIGTLGKAGFDYVKAIKLPELVQGVPARLRPEVNKALLKAVDGRWQKGTTLDGRFADAIKKADIPTKYKAQIIDKMKEIDTVRVYDGMSTFIVKNPTGTYTTYGSFGDSISPLGEFAARKDALAAAHDIVMGVRQDLTTAGKILNGSGVKLYNEYNKAFDKLSRIATDVKKTKDGIVKFEQKDINYLVDTAKKVGVKQRDILDFQKTIGTADVESSVKKFTDVVINRLEAGETKKAIDQTRKTVKKLMVSVGKLDKGDVEGRAMSGATKKVVKELDELLNLQVSNNLTTYNMSFAGDYGSKVGNLKKAIDGLSKQYMDTNNIDPTTGQYVTDILEGIKNNITELGRTGNLNMNKVSELSRLASLAKNMSASESSKAVAFNNKAVSKFIEKGMQEIGRTADLRGNSFILNSRLTQEVRTGFHRVLRAFGGIDSEVGRTLANAQQRGQENVGRMIHYGRTQINKLARERGINPKAAFEQLKEKVAISDNILYTGSGIKRSGVQEISRDQLLSYYLMLKDPDSVKNIATTGGLILKGAKGKDVRINLGLKDPKLIEYRTNIQKNMQVLKKLQTDIKKDMSLADAIKKHYATIKDMPDDIKALYKEIRKFQGVDKKGAKDALKRIAETIDDYQQKITSHKNTYGWTHEEINSNIKELGGKLEKSKMAIERKALAIQKAKGDKKVASRLLKEKSKLEQEYKDILKEYNQNPAINGSMQKEMSELLETYMTPEMRMLADHYRLLTNYNANLVNAQTLNVFGAPIANNPNYWHIRRLMAGIGSQGTRQSITHRDIFKPRTGGTQDIVLNTFTQQSQSGAIDAAFFSGAFKDIYMLERLANSPKFTQKMLDIWRKYPKFKNVMPKMADDIAMLGTRETGDQMAGALSYGMKKVQSMYMSNLNLFVASGQLSSIPAASSAGISLRYLLNPANARYLKKDYITLHNQGFFTARWRMGHSTAISGRIMSSFEQTMVGELGSMTMITNADSLAITNIYTAARMQIAARMGLDAYHPAVVDAALKKTMDAVLLTQPQWTDITRAGYTRFKLAALAFNPFRTARDAMLNGMIYGIEQGKPIEAIAGYLSSQLLYVSNRMVKNTAMAGITAFANEEVRGVFVDEDNDVWETAKRELGSALSGTLPFFESITNVGANLWKQMLSTPSANRSMFSGNLFERTYVKPFEDIVSATVKAAEYWAIQSNARNTVIFNAMTGKYDIFSPDGDKVSSTDNPAMYILSEVYKGNRKEAFHALSSDSKAQYVKLALKTLQYTLLFAANMPTAAYATEQIHNVINTGGDNAMVSTNVYEYGKDNYKMSSNQVRDLIVNTGSDWNKFSRQLEKDVGLSNLAIFASDSKDKPTKDNVAAAILPFINHFGNMLGQPLRQTSQIMMYEHLNKSWGKEIDAENFEMAENSFFEFTKQKRDFLEDMKDLYNSSNYETDKYKIVKSGNIWRLVRK